MDNNNYVKVEKDKLTEVMLNLFDFIYSNNEKMIIFSDRISDKYNIPKTITNMPDSFCEKYVHPSYHKALKEAFEKCNKGERKCSVEIKDVKDNHWFEMILETAEKNPDGTAKFSVGMFGITDRLHSLEGRANLMTEISKVAIKEHYVRVFLLNRTTGRYSYFNQNVNEDEESWVSLDSDNTFDEYVTEYSKLANSDEDKEKIMSLRLSEIERNLENNNGKFSTKYCIQTENGLKWFMVECSFYREERYIIGLISDATNEELQKKKLKEALAMAEDANTAKGTFLANMSHEIRTPMNAIIGISEILLSRELPTEIRNEITTIQNAGSGLLAIINDILDFSKIESGKFEIVPVEYMLQSLLMDVSNMISVRVSDKPVRFLMNVDSKIPAKMIGDDIRIRQILMNLLGNSVKFTKEGHISLDVLGNKKENGLWELIFKISDTGIGIKEEDMGKLFKTFSQVDTKKNRAVTGTGLGLNISKNLAVMMGGDITVTSTYGLGSQFTVTIMQKNTNEDPIGKIETKDRKKVLICENDEVIISSIGRSLENLGVEYRICRNFDKIRSFEDMTHVIIRRRFFDENKSRLEFVFEKENIYLILENNEHSLEQYMEYRQIQLPLAGLQLVRAFNHEEIITSYRKHGFDRTKIMPLEFARALIVDDNSTNLQVAKGLLTPYKMTIDTANGGYKALELVKNIKYDIIFMDHMMPEMDGVETTEYIRKMNGDYYKNVPIVALTANAMSDARDMFLQSGFNDFIAKPIEMSELNRVLKKYVAKNAPAGYTQKQIQNETAAGNASACNSINAKPLKLKNETVLLLEQNNLLLKQNMKLLESLYQGNAAQEYIEISNEETANDGFETENTVENVYENVIPEINTVEALKIYGNNYELYSNIVSTFYDDLCEKSESIKDMYDKTDMKNLTIAAHSVKSAAKEVGANILSDMAATIERYGKEENTDKIKELFDSFLAKLVETKENIGTYGRVFLKNTAKEEKAAKENRDSFDEKKVQILKECSDKMDYDEMDAVLKDMSQFNYPASLNETLDMMTECLNNFEYDKLDTLIADL